MTPEHFSELSKLNPEESAALIEILKDPHLAEWAHLIAEQCFIPEEPGKEPELPEGNDLSKAWFAAAYFGADSAVKHYRKKGIPAEVLYETMTDITAWLRNTKRNRGVIGIGYGRTWQAILYHGTVTRHGRLECNTESFYSGPEWKSEDGTVLVREGDPVIQLHIPEDGPMYLVSCGKSMKRMSDFFAETFPSYDWKGFHCVSWLFDPQLIPMLSKQSNILKFFSLGYTDPVDIISDTKFRIFGTTEPDAVKDPTSLQRAAAAFLRSGGVFKEGALFIPRRSIESVDYNLEKLLISRGSC